MLSLTNKLKNIKLQNSITKSIQSYIAVNNNNNNNNNNHLSTSFILNTNNTQIFNYNKANYCKKKGDKNDKIEILDKERSSEDTIETLSKELLQFDKPSNKRKDWPLNSEVLIFPSYSVSFIGATGPINIGQQYINRLIPNASGKTFIGIFLLKEKYRNSPQPVKSIDAIHDIGVLADVTYSPYGYYNFEITKRIKIKEIQNGQYPFSAIIEPYNGSDNNTINKEEEKAKVEELIEKINTLSLKFQHLYPSVYTGNKSISFKEQIQSIEDPENYLSAITIYYGLNYPNQCQDILETPSLVKRLEKIYDIILNEEPLLSTQQQIAIELEEKSSANQKKLLLTEQLKKIKAQLGFEVDEKELAIEKYQNKLASLVHISEGNKKVIQDEISKLSTIDPSSVEYSTSKNYIEWLTNLPWGIYTPEFFDLKYSKDVLDSDHYGLADIKQRILEFISIGHLKGTVQGKIICFIGPPGTGKTSIAKSIAKCLKKEFYRFSVGGLMDESEIKGHRRTYVGSMPGKIIQALKLTQTSNPLILIDEIDKIGKRNLGDPSSALLEVLDPEQNSSFVDHYLDTPYDLSKVLFICTANSDKTIPAALFDRMEIIRLPGYIEEEQIQIVKNFVIPKTFIDCGIKYDQLSISDDVIVQLVKYYSREVGIRELEKLIEKIMRKTALKLVNGTAERVEVTMDNLEEFLGIPSYSSDRYYEITPVGVVNGLAYNTKGGSTLYIESTAERIPKTKFKGSSVASEDDDKLNQPTLKTTGKLGEVMSESSTIAYTFAKNFLYEIQPDNKFFSNHNIHLHSPQGDQAKEGPSAGVTMATSLLSLALNEPVVNNLGMTGELTITGKVVTIGGVKEKTIAAKRSGLTSIVFPINNQINFEELPDYIKNGIDVKYANEYKDVFQIAFPNKKNLLNNIK